jgi:hypothetical protein
MDWESWLRTASKPPSDNEDAKRQATEDQIRAALRNYGPLSGKPYTVYVKGSYANNTNVRLDYDVDIAVEYYGHFYYEFIFGAKELGPGDAGITTPSTDPYSNDQFKTDVRAALVNAFGESAVETGDIAYRVRQRKTTLPADVVPCWEFRRYDRVIGRAPQYTEGSRVFPRSGGEKTNYPKRQLESGTAKNVATGNRYKRMVRALKKLQAKLVAEGSLKQELPSYFTECLVYNVPNSAFNHNNYVDDMRSVLAEIFNATLSDEACKEWEQVNGLFYLFHGDFKRNDAHHMADAAWTAMGFE